MRRALVTATVLVGRQLVVEEPGDAPNDLPKRLTTATRVPSLHALRVRDVAVAIGPSDSTVFGETGNADAAAVTALFEGSDLDDPFERAQPALEEVIDALAFQLQAPIRVVALNVVDVTGALSVGEDRESRSYASAETVVSPKFAAMPQDFRWNIVPIGVPTIDASHRPPDERTRMALWWYAKALSTPFAIDTFIALWTGLEILWEASEGTRVTGPYMPRCGHALSECPRCGQSVEQLVRGPSLRAFLQEIGVAEPVAKQMWKIRQAVHGADVFSRQRVQVAGELAGELRVAVLVLLKQRLGYAPEDPPLVLDAGGPTLRPEVRLDGHRPLAEDDAALVELLSSVQ